MLAPLPSFTISQKLNFVPAGDAGDNFRFPGFRPRRGRRGQNSVSGTPSPPGTPGTAGTIFGFRGSVPAGDAGDAGDRTRPNTQNTRGQNSVSGTPSPPGTPGTPGTIFGFGDTVPAGDAGDKIRFRGHRPRRGRRGQFSVLLPFEKNGGNFVFLGFCLRLFYGGRGNVPGQERSNFHKPRR